MLEGWLTDRVFLTLKCLVSYKVASMLLNYGAAVNVATRKKETALSIALGKGQ